MYKRQPRTDILVPDPVDWQPRINQAVQETAPASSGITFLHDAFAVVDQLIAYAERHFVVPESPSTPFRFHPFWRDVFRDGMQTRPGHVGMLDPGWLAREMLTSTGRKNAKSTSLAAIIRALNECADVLAHMTNVEIPIFSSSASMGGVISTQYKALAEMHYMTPTQSEKAQKAGTLGECAPGTYYRQEAAPGTGAGRQLTKWTNVHSGRSFRIYPFSIRSMVGMISRLFAIFDELGDAPGSDIFDTYRTGQSSALLAVISTQGKVDSPMHKHVQQLLHMPKSSRYSVRVHAADMES